MKKLYEFTVDKEETVQEPTIGKDEAGQEVKGTKSVVKKVPHKFFLKRPSRRSWDDADLFYAVSVSEGIKKGLLSRAQLTAKFSNEGETISEVDKKTYSNAYVKLYKAREILEKLELVKDDAKTPEQVAEKETTLASIALLERDLREFELSQASLYDHTAEVRARNRVVLWWIFELAYADGAEPTPVFGDGSFEDKLSRYDTMEEQEDVFMLTVANRFLYYVSFWYSGKAKSAEDFAKLEQTPVIKEDIKA